MKEFESELNLTDDETTLYYQLFERLYSIQNNDTKKRVHFISDNDLLTPNFTFGKFQSMFASSRHMHSVENLLEIKLTINPEDFSHLGLYLFSSWFWYSDTDNIEEKFLSYLELMHLKNDDLVLLCLHSLLSIPFSLPKSIEVWKKIFSVIYSINHNRKLITSTLEKSSNALTALYLALIFRLYEKEIDLSLLIRRLSALVTVQNLYSSMKCNNESADVKLNEFTVESLFMKNRYDHLLELITCRMVEASIEPSWLTSTATDSNLKSLPSKNSCSI